MDNSLHKTKPDLFFRKRNLKVILRTLFYLREPFEKENM